MAKMSLRKSSGDEDWFGPGMDLMMSLFAIILGVLALVFWQKARLIARNAKLETQLTAASTKPFPDNGKGSVFFSQAELLAKLKEKEMLIAKLQESIIDLKLQIESLQKEKLLLETQLKDATAKLAQLDWQIRKLTDQVQLLTADLERAHKDQGEIKLKPIRELQNVMWRDLAQCTGLNPVEASPTQIQLTDGRGRNSITILNDGYLQTLRFGADTLFDVNSFHVAPEAEELLKTVAKVVYKYRAAFKEIQFQGHADTNEPEDSSNITLATKRASQLYIIFYESGLHPWSNLMSISTYGHYKPVTRVPGSPYSRNELTRANLDSESRKLNRRVEVFLIYSTPE